MMHSNLRSEDSRFSQHLARQYGFDTVPSLATMSRGGPEFEVARMHYALPHLFVLPPLPAEDAFLIGIEIASGGSRRLVKDGHSIQLGLQREGALHIYALSERTTAYVCSPFHSILFHLPRAAIDSFAEEMAAPRIQALHCDTGTIDWVTASLGKSMLPVLMHPKEANRLFVDHVILALMAHIIHVYGNTQSAVPTRAKGLAAWQERRAKEFLLEHIGRDVSLADLARECALSRSHFSKAFKQTTGQSPHAWLVSQRLDLARRLLSKRDLSIAQIAAACGFADQSHMTRFNSSATRPLHFLQIWIMPAAKGVSPRYQQVHFGPAEKRGRLRLIISPEGTAGSLAIRQDTRVYAGLFDGEETASLELGLNRYAYVHVTRGCVQLNGTQLSEGDGARVRDERQLDLARGDNAEVLVFDLRPNELPSF